MLIRGVLVPISLALAPATGFAQSSDTEASSIAKEAGEPADLPSCVGSCLTLQEENDAFSTHAPTDSSYTQGLRLQSRWTVDPRKRLTHLRNSRESWGFEIGQNIYTPTSIADDKLPVLVQDRPYAGWLYGGALFDLAWKGSLPFASGADTEFDGSHHLGIELTLGTTGPRAQGGPVQSSWHGLLRSVNHADTPVQPKGWGLYETANRWSLDMALRYERDVLGVTLELGSFTSGTGSVIGMRLNVRSRADLGLMFDGVGLGTELRVGLLPGRGLGLSGNRVSLVPFRLYGYVRCDGRLVFYNGLIQSGLLNGVASEVGRKVPVGELSFGGVLQILGLEAVFGQQIRTAELTNTGPGVPANHRIGQIQVSLLFN